MSDTSNVFVPANLAAIAHGLRQCGEPRLAKVSAQFIRAYLDRLEELGFEVRRADKPGGTNYLNALDVQRLAPVLAEIHAASATQRAQKASATRNANRPPKPNVYDLLARIEKLEALVFDAFERIEKLGYPVADSAPNES